jgi:hypothetical protein
MPGETSGGLARGHPTGHTGASGDGIAPSITAHCRVADCCTGDGSCY